MTGITTTISDQTTAAPAPEVQAPETHPTGPTEAGQATSEQPTFDQTAYESGANNLKRLQFSPEVIQAMDPNEVIGWDGRYATQRVKIDQAFAAQGEYRRHQESQSTQPGTPQEAPQAGDFAKSIVDALGDSVSSEVAEKLANVISTQVATTQDAQDGLQAAQIERTLEDTRSTLLNEHPRLNEPAVWMETKATLQRIQGAYEPGQWKQALQDAAGIATGRVPANTPVVPDPNKQRGQIGVTARTGTVPASAEDRKMSAAAAAVQKHFG